MTTASVAGALAVGLSLGLTGAGGSILTLPVLVYLAGIPPREAIPLSLLVVGSAALAGTVLRWHRGEIHLKAVGYFAAAGAIGALAGSRLTNLVPPTALMIIFAALMLAVAGSMFRNPGGTTTPAPECRPLVCLQAGLGTGLLTGFLGVGGGFLLVPALLRFARLPLPLATGTSLAIITLNSTAGFLSHLHRSQIQWSLALLFIVLAVAGTLVGSHLATRLPTLILKRGFAILVLATAGFVLWQSAKGS